MKITQELILKLEKLSRLELNPKERQKITVDLSNILEMVSKLNDLDTKGVEPLIYMNDENSELRKDSVKTWAASDEILDNAAEAEDGYFKVKKVIQGPK